MNLRVSRRAAKRLREIADYIHARNPYAARDVQEDLADAFRLLTRYPESGRLMQLGVRRLVVPRRPYLIFYKADRVTDTVTIITVRHAAQRDEP